VTELDGRRIARLRVAPGTPPGAAVPVARLDSSGKSQVEGG
jgi:hypothetical protein